MTILEEALRVLNARTGHYGSPGTNWKRTAKLWSALLGIEIQPHVVGLMNILQKCSREMSRPKRDNMVDVAGYAHGVDLIHQGGTK